MPDTREHHSTSMPLLRRYEKCKSERAACSRIILQTASGVRCSPLKTNRFWLFRSTERKEDQGVADGMVQMRYGLLIEDAEPVKEHPRPG